MNLEQLRAALRAALDTRAAHEARIDEIVGEAEKRGDNTLTAVESTEIGELRTAVKAIDEQRSELTERISDLEARAAARAEADAQAAALPTPSVTKAVGGAIVRKEERTYSPGAESRGVSFLRDVASAQLGNDFAASQRLSAHMNEEKIERSAYLGGIEMRDVATSAFAGLVVPQYLVDLAAPAIKNKRPFLDVCNKHTLPAMGMTLNLSRITTQTTVTVQATENAGASETDIDDTLLTVNVRTYSGQQDMSRQAVERGTGTEDIMIADLIGSYHASLDSGCLNDDGTSGTHLGVRNVSGNSAVTYTDADPTAAELHPKLAGLIADMSSGTDEGLTHFVFHPRRWWWLASQLGTSFPLLTVGGAGIQQAGTLGGTGYEASGRGYLGAGIVLDRNIPTNVGAGTEDVIVGINSMECHLWEDPNAPLLIRAEQTGAGNLSIKYVVYGYSAFTAGRYPKATGDITGTGLIAPTF